MAVNASWCLSFTFRDKKGQTRKITLCYDAEGVATTDLADYLANSAQASVTALQACSNAHVQQEINFLTGGAAQSGVTYGSAGDYQSVSLQARLYYLTVDPSGDPSPTGTITIPAPKESMFLADKVTINPADANIAALNAALVAAVPVTNGFGVATKSGLQYKTFVGGILIGKKLSRKWNKYTLDPTLTVAGI